MSQSRNRIIHPILLSTYPVLFIFSQNVSEIHPSDLILPMIVTMVLGVCFWLASGLVLKDKAKAALAASLSMMMLLLFKHAYDFFISVTDWSGLLRRYALIFWFVLYVAGLLAIFRAKKGFNTATRLANVFSVSVTLLTIITIGTFYLHNETKQERTFDGLDLEWVRKWSRSESNSPDIYYIVLDGYGRADALDKSYSFDNQIFLKGLKSQDFFVAKRSTSNYSSSHESIASSLNMNYVHDANYQTDKRTLTNFIKNNRVAQIMRSLGYKYVLVPSGFYYTNSSPLTDVTIDLGIWTQSQLSALLIEYSAVWFTTKFSESLGQSNRRQQAIVKGMLQQWSGTAQWYRHITESIDAIGKIAEMEEQTFTFAHIICPHPPYVFNRDGSLYTGSKMADMANFDNYNWWCETKLCVNQILHLNSLLEKMITRLLNKSSSPPIIIIHGDHGTYALSGKRWIHDNPSTELINERMSILLAIFAPDSVQRSLYDSITPVNIFRTVFNEVFGAHFPLLPAKNFWSYKQPIEDVTDVVANNNVMRGQ